MAVTTLEQEILRIVRKLPPDLQQRVRDFARSLATTPPRQGMSAPELLDWLQGWDREAREDLARALEEERGREKARYRAG